MDSWGQLSSFKHHVYLLTERKRWLLMCRKWMLYSECCQQDFLTVAWLTGLTCPPLDLYILKASEHFKYYIRVRWGFDKWFPFDSHLVWNTLLLCQHHSFQNGQAFCFASHGFQKLKIKEIVRSQVKKVCLHSKLLMMMMMMMLWGFMSSDVGLTYCRWLWPFD